jgi:hypothetical protein
MASYDLFAKFYMASLIHIQKVKVIPVLIVIYWTPYHQQLRVICTFLNVRRTS